MFSEKLLFVCNILLDKLINRNKEIRNVVIKKILIIKWDEIGDMAACAHVFGKIRKAFPNAIINVIAKNISAELIQYDKNINEVFKYENAFNKKYDLVLEMRGTWKTFFKSFWLMPKLRYSRAEIRLKNKGMQLHEWKTNDAIIEKIIEPTIENCVCFFNEKVEQETIQFLSENNIENYIVIHPGARRELRRWPTENFVQLLNFIQGKYDCKFVFIGSIDEETQIQNIKNKLNFNTYIFPFDLSINHTSALINGCYLYIGNESGPLQIADALNKKSLSFFGPGVANVFYPQTIGSKILHVILECNPCDQVNCKHPKNPCINRISVAEAIEVAGKLLD